MMFKLRIVQFLAVIAVVSASVIKESGEDSTSAEKVETEVTRNYFIALKLVFLSSKIGPMFYDIASRTTDHKCVDEHIKKFNFTQKLTDLVEVDYNELTLSIKQELSEIVWKPLRLCNSKSRSISDTVFDMLMSFGHIS